MRTSDGSSETALELYRSMLKIRLTEERIARLYPSDKIQSPIHLCTGQESVSAGVSRSLRPEDRLYGTYRGHGLYVARGGDLRKLFAELFGKQTGCAGGRGGSMHLVAPEVGLMGCSAIVASMIPVATGDALASEMQGRPHVIAAVFGEGAIDEGVFFESINFALLKKLPILYVCENNRYAVHSRLGDRRVQTEIYRVGEGLGLPGSRFEGSDAMTVFGKTADALDAIRKGGGPQLLEFMTRRWCEHVGPAMDAEAPYRDPDEAGRLREEDPIRIASAKLLRDGTVTETTLERWRAEIESEIDEAVRYAEESPFPAPELFPEQAFEVRR